MLKMVVSLLIFAASVATAWARGPYETLQVGNWTGGAYIDDQTNRFSHCAASVDFINGGGTLYVWMNRDLSWSIGVERSSINYRIGSRFNVGLSMDNVGAYNLEAEVRHEHFFIVGMPGDDATVEAFQAAQYLYVQMPDDTFSYSLTSTRQLIPALQDCVQSHRDDYSIPGSSGENNVAPPNPPPLNTQTQAARDKVIKDAANEYNNCMAANTKDIVPYSNESAEVIAQVIFTKCQDVQNHFVDLTMAIYGVAKPEAEKLIADSVEARKKTLVADIVTFRAEVNKTLSQQKQPAPSSAATTAGQGL